MQDEFQINNIVIAESTSEIYSAKIKELQNWSNNNVYNEVTGKGQILISGPIVKENRIPIYQSQSGC